jgi:curved DNA-binding protein CbpA
MEPKNYYKILRVSPGAGHGEIREAYRKLALVYHPDLIKTSNSQQVMTQLNEAYEVLGDPKKRAIYDAGRSSATGPTGESSPRPTRKGGPLIYTPEEWKRLVLVRLMTGFVILLGLLFLWALSTAKYDLVFAILLAGTFFLRKLWTIFRIESAGR